MLLGPSIQHGAPEAVLDKTTSGSSRRATAAETASCWAFRASPPAVTHQTTTTKYTRLTWRSRARPATRALAKDAIRAITCPPPLSPRRCAVIRTTTLPKFTFAPPLSFCHQSAPVQVYYRRSYAPMGVSLLDERNLERRHSLPGTADHRGDDWGSPIRCSREDDEQIRLDSDSDWPLR